MTKHSLSAGFVSPHHAAECTIQRSNGSFCGSPVVPNAPASVCAKHAARIFMFMRDAVAGGDRSDLLMKMVGTMEQANAEATARTPYRPEHDVVYYVRVGDHIKIGTTSNLRQRMFAYPTGRLLATEPGSLTVEMKRHAQFADELDAGREWFRITPRLMEHIRTVAAH